MVKHTKPVRKLLKRSAKFRKRVEKAFTKRHKDADLLEVHAALELVDRSIVKLGRKKPGTKRKTALD